VTTHQGFERAVVAGLPAPHKLPVRVIDDYSTREILFYHPTTLALFLCVGD
jgi:hypothetical protein